MKAHPLPSLTIDQAIAMQFKLVDAITREFDGYEILTNGDLGVHPAGNQPQTTRKVERVLADLFDAEDACFVRGAGTSAIREGLASCTKSGDKVLVHTSPIYSTTITTFEHLGLEAVSCDFNNLESIKQTLQEHADIQTALIQYTRQSLEDSYDMDEVIACIKGIRAVTIVTDDNYAVMKVAQIGSQLGADMSCFSMFKLLGPEGIGCVVGNRENIASIRKFHYSGGTQTQGFEAMEAMRSLVYAPVALAVQAQEINKIAQRLNAGEITGVEEAVVVNAQSKVVLVKFSEPIAKQILEATAQHGAAAYPVGAESKYEVVPMIYRVSGTMLASDPAFSEYWVRINPMRSGADTVIRIIKEALEQVISCS
ncbi:aminotransferase class V-fold PLP-dependent enzyme [Erysipelothrix sp. HDW6C]|uniref:aminotransferase class V-fold PLP-dependent enzyme n=1 Tax=Erysipelothrix sp. HDW6C TaxID=2714930 RepID=UPI00140CF1D5|nr:aminotransferase class V-fold PLP-dependent enzyme [Erysipelothrix sp. HDW6C]QIK70404.1 aminotransferase class V-fold PLP-dependent enzyme [Erysipelothrix sp. HDW6C]